MTTTSFGMLRFPREGWYMLGYVRVHTAGEGTLWISRYYYSKLGYAEVSRGRLV